MNIIGMRIARGQLSLHSRCPSPRGVSRSHKPAFVGMNLPSQHLKPTSVVICIELSISGESSRKSNMSTILTVVGSHMTATGAPVSVVLKTSLTRMFVARINRWDLDAEEEHKTEPNAPVSG